VSVPLSDKLLLTKEEVIESGIPALAFERWDQQRKLDRAKVLTSNKTVKFNRNRLQQILDGLSDETANALSVS
jgi:hypothetical protein